MIYRDAIRENEFLRLAAERGTCVSIFLPTSRVTQDAQSDRIRFGNLVKQAMAQAAVIADRRAIRAMEAMAQELADDEVFWAYQAYGLGVLLTPGRIRSYRLAYEVKAAAEVSDRFHLKPLVPALQPKSAYVLALAQKHVKLHEFTPARELLEVEVPDLPRDMSAVTARLQPVDPEVVPKLVDGDGMRKVLLTQFVRSVERAVRPVVSASRVPLILAATDEIGAIYRSLNHYELLAEQTIGGSIDTSQEEEALRQAVIPIVQALRQARLDRWVALYRQRQDDNRAVADLATIARLASQGQVSHLLVDIDQVQYGQLDERGKLSLTPERSAESYDVIDETIVRVMQAGGEVLAVRRDERAPAELMPIAAVLRWAG